MAETIYDVVKSTLEFSRMSREDDRVLIWEVLKLRGFITEDPWGNEYLNKDEFLRSPSPESIHRARRKVQENHPGLEPTNPEVRRLRRMKELEKGTFIFREEATTGSLFNANN